MQSDRRMQLSDEELYRQMRKGNRDAFAQLYERREPGLYRFALHMSGSPAVAEEVSNEVFVQLMGPAARFDETRGSLESFLYGIARNLVRVVRRQPPVAEPVDRAFEANILGELIGNETTAALHRTLRELPERYRDVIILCDLEERSYEDVARLIGRPVGTVRSRLHRGRALLAAKLKRLNAPSEVFSA
ncbi:MAG TPA: sigma-70 family RNA polymerase sigma factor [Bryobacteraceae bacterium]|jgi:RNA polymerase sigma-70 factor (ECF subfamily)|nr:sigma-70 family RNA polymerase sigma factor [Bryobacteraceae bacterium]